MASSSDIPYAGLTPDKILDAVESGGFAPSGSLLALNSYENRVYQVGLEDNTFLVTKFYRPGRWSDAAIDEEHTFSLELRASDLPVVAPLERDGTTLFDHQGFRFAVFPRQGGHPPNLERRADFAVLARTISRIHAVGAAQSFTARPALTATRLGADSRAFLLAEGWLPADLEEAYASITEHLLAAIEARMPAVTQRIHGDCHMGNVLWRDDLPHFVDLDDCMMGPEIQDLWMLLSGDRADQEAQLKVLLDAYLPFHELDLTTLASIEALRSLRIMHHAAWLARRWDDPAFAQAFVWFGTDKYWAEHILSLREQQALLAEPPLEYFA